MEKLCYSLYFYEYATDNERMLQTCRVLYLLEELDIENKLNAVICIPVVNVINFSVFTPSHAFSNDTVSKKIFSIALLNNTNSENLL